MTNERIHIEGAPHGIEELLSIVHALRDPEHGCSWDCKQTHETLKKCLEDECQEVLEAIDHRDDENLCEELGDVLLQVLLHAEIASERSVFSWNDVVQMLTDKLIRRHPHVFGDESRPEKPEDALALWGKVKKREKQAKYRFYGWEQAGRIQAKTTEYPGIETVLDLFGELKDIWCARTCAPRMRDRWSEENPTCGQCSITAFLAQDIFGGEVRAMMTEGGNLHCFNVVDGVIFDLTDAQFGEKAKDLVYEGALQERESEGHFGKEEKRSRYEYLKTELMKHCSAC